MSVFDFKLSPPLLFGQRSKEERNRSQKRVLFETQLKNFLLFFSADNYTTITTADDYLPSFRICSFACWPIFDVQFGQCGQRVSQGIGGRVVTTAAGTGRWQSLVGERV